MFVLMRDEKIAGRKVAAGLVKGDQPYVLHLDHQGRQLLLLGLALGRNGASTREYTNAGASRGDLTMEMESELASAATVPKDSPGLPPIGLRRMVMESSVMGRVELVLSRFW